MKETAPVIIVVSVFVSLACSQTSEHLSISDIPVPAAAIDVRDRSGFLGPTDAVSFKIETPHRSLTVIEFYDEWATNIGWSRLSTSDDSEVSVEWEDAVEPRKKRKVLRYRAVWLSVDQRQKMTVVVSCDFESSVDSRDVQYVLVMLMKNRKTKGA
jgi:hypothetical protein